MPRLHVTPIHTPEQVAEILDTALAIVRGAEVEGDLRLKAFEKAVDMLATRNVAIEQGPPLPLPTGLLGRQ